MNKNSSSPKRAPYRNAAPLFAFVFSICLLVVCCYEAGHTSLPPTEKRYTTAKAGISSLRQDAKKNMQREPWEKLASEFKAIYDTDPAWPNRAAALFRAGEALEELAKRSCNRADARKAINCYESLALKHGQSRLADDALFRAARIRAALLRDDKGALALLARIRKQYPKGDMLSQATALENAIRASASGKTAPEAIKTAALGAADTLDDLPAATSKTKTQFAGDIPLRFKAAKSRMAALRKDSNRACWRQPWENLREEFLRIRNQAKSAIAAEALLKAAECQKSLAQCSRLVADYTKAIELYKRVSAEFPKSDLADDALLEAARLEYALAKDKKNNKASATLQALLSKYPEGDKAGEAKKLLSIWNGAAPSTALTEKTPAKADAKNAGQSELQVLSWDSINKNNVEITLEFTNPAKYSTRLEKNNQGKSTRLVLELPNAAVVADIRRGVAVNGSLLKAIKVADGKDGSARLLFDFREIKDFAARAEQNPHRIVLNVSAKAGKATKSALAAKQGNAIQVRAAQMQDMASQLGLTVKRVFIDAGHGGKDPGTAHNQVVEKDITLDVALSLGKLLEANGLEVIYSRTINKAVPLSERTRMANRANADIFVSIHVNANANASASGLETYYLDLATNKQAAMVAMLENAASDKRLGDMQSMLTEVMLHARANESRNLASSIQRLTISRLKQRTYSTRSNGVKSAPFHVLLGARMPAVLVEIGYCSNKAEASNLASPKYRQALAIGLAEGIVSYKERLIRNRTADKTLTGKKPGAI